MHIVSFLRSDHSEPPGSKLEICNIGHNSRYDYTGCGRQFLQNCSNEFNHIYHNTTIVDVGDARSFIFRIGSFRATCWQSKICNIGHSSRYDYARYGRQFLRNCSIEFNQIYHSTTIISEVDARCFISKIGSFRATWWQIENL